ncbi:MAG: hypothetical protein JXA97_03005 [Anaerolineales bacterium]|nr:hypothetical protein [Anaerolineales bacterium]
MIFIGMDDTDTLQSRGTGHLAREVAAELAEKYPVVGVTRHQLLEDARVPCTARNSCAAILLGSDQADLDALFAKVKAIMLADFQEGSDPGLCVADLVPDAVIAFGRTVQQELVSQDAARTLAARSGLRLAGLGGEEDGVIGALAAVGLAACGEDGRYVQVGRIRSLHGMRSVKEILAAGAASVETLTGDQVSSGMVLTDKLRPARRGHQPIVVVEPMGADWRPLKLN